VAERALVIGLGAWDRGDDAAGLVVAARLHARLEGRARVVVGCADAFAFVAELEGAARVVLVDSLQTSDCPAGTLQQLDLARAAPPPQPPRLSGHGDALGAGWRLARTLGVAPPFFRIWGVVGRDFGLGAPLSAAVRAALEPLTAAVLVEVGGSASEVEALQRQADSTGELDVAGRREVEAVVGEELRAG
jgi:hydrogenase maturation protease